MTLEDLLRSTVLTNGRISLDTHGDGRWSASVCHFNGHMTHPMGVDHADPVNALRAALIEDSRRDADLVRRYQAAPKLGTDVEDVLG